MSIELKYLALTAMLTASLWIPYIVAQATTNRFLRPENYVDPTPRKVPLWGQRADRVYLNAVETFAPFAALVILIQLTGKADAIDRLRGQRASSGSRRARRRLSRPRLPYTPHDRVRGSATFR
jgi:Predicted membrane protein